MADMKSLRLENERLRKRLIKAEKELLEQRSISNNLHESLVRSSALSRGYLQCEQAAMDACIDMAALKAHSEYMHICFGLYWRTGLC